ncbi:MAG: hypothetical protein FJ363_03820 [Gemmatimonadetes bacterium]|nr:hypothetical protein [Gemmatimonadota bacterium]
MLYEPRESINPRTFALRHALLEELKFRQRSAGDTAARAALTALARALDVSYDATAREFVVRGAGPSAHRVPLDALQLYEPRRDAKVPSWDRQDEVLAANRAFAGRLVDTLLADARRGTA